MNTPANRPSKYAEGFIMTSIERFLAGLAIVAVMAYVVAACGCGGEAFTSLSALTVEDGGGTVGDETGDANGGDGGSSEDSAHPGDSGGQPDSQLSDAAPGLDAGVDSAPIGEFCCFDRPFDAATPDSGGNWCVAYKMSTCGQEDAGCGPVGTRCVGLPEQGGCPGHVQVVCP